MKHLVLFLFSFFFAFLSSAQKKVEFLTDFPFRVLSASGNFHIALHQDSLYRATVVSEEGKSAVEWKLKGDTLLLSSQTVLPCVVYLNYYELNSILLAGRVSLSSDLLCSFSNLELSVSGETSTDLLLTLDTLHSSHTGKSEVRLRGRAQHWMLSMRRNALLEAFSFDAVLTEVELTGTSTSYLSSNKGLYLTAKDASVLHLKGVPGYENVLLEGNATIVVEDSTHIPESEILPFGRY